MRTFIEGREGGRGERGGVVEGRMRRGLWGDEREERDERVEVVEAGKLYQKRKWKRRGGVEEHTTGED